MNERKPSVCTDTELRTMICKTDDAPRREKALQRFVEGTFGYTFNGYLFSTLAGYATNKKWKCTSEKIREACADAYIEFKKNTGKPGSVDIFSKSLVISFLNG
jgi:hypothetical protein